MPDDDASVHKICARGDKQALTRLLKKDRNILKLTDEEYGQTPLHVSCEYGREEIVQLLLQDKYQGKFDLNAVDKNGWTPLHSACKSGHLDIIEWLVNKGAFCRAVTNEGASPLHYFVRNECKDPLRFHKVISLLVKRAAVIDVENRHGETPLHQAAMRGRSQNVLYLLNNKANPNAQTRHGETALYFAARGNHVDTVNILLQMSADPTMDAAPEIGSLYSVAHKVSSLELKRMLFLWYANNKKKFPQEMQIDPDLDSIRATVSIPSESGGGGSTSSSGSGNSITSSSSNTVNTNMADDGSGSQEEDDKARRRRKKKTKEEKPQNFRSPRVVERKSKAMNRVRSQRDMDDSKSPSSSRPQKRDGSTNATSDDKHNFARVKRQRSNSLSTPDLQLAPSSNPASPRGNPMGETSPRALYHAAISAANTPVSSSPSTPMNTSTTSVGATENTSSASLNERIEMLTRRTAALRGEGDEQIASGSPAKTAPMTPGVSVRSAIASFEQRSVNSPASSPVPASGSPVTIDRILQLKQNAATNVNVREIEEKVARSRQNSNSSGDNIKTTTDSLRLELTRKTSSPDVARESISSARSVDISLLKKEEILKKLKDGWQCKICHKSHSKLPLYLFCANPYDYDEMAPSDKESRSKISADLCSIDNLKFFVRGLLEIPIKVENNSDPDKEDLVLTWGAWVCVDTSDFYKIMENWKTSETFTVQGQLNNNIPSYEDSLGLPVSLNIRTGGLRPLILLDPEKSSSLLTAVKDKITVPQLEAIFEIVLHKD